jgi:uncharacterized repeat protein (TIGR04076 family)
MVEQKPSRSKVKITVVRRFNPSEVFNKSPAETTRPFPICDQFTDGQEFIVGEDGRMPSPDFCNAAWEALWEPVRTLAFGGNYPWFKEKGVSINCCTDGVRPVVFKLQRIEE